MAFKSSVATRERGPAVANVINWFQASTSSCWHNFTRFWRNTASSDTVSSTSLLRKRHTSTVPQAVAVTA
ncbi:hypothetical protein HS125_06810 [bacterium]|nr:hypothetical protein [bacterium]